MKKISGWMDFSNKKKEDPLFDISKSGTPGFMKDEMGSSKLSQVIALRTKWGVNITRSHHDILLERLTQRISSCFSNITYVFF